MFLTKISIKRPVLITVVILIPVIFGLMSIFTIGIDEWPDIELPFIGVTIVYPGASPETLESDVVEHIEEAMAQVSGVEKIKSSIKESYAVIWTEMSLDTDVDIAAQDMREKISMIRNKLPEDIEEPIIAKYDPGAFPVISLALIGDASLFEKSKLVDDLIKERLQSVSGVGAVKVYGDIEEEVVIELNKDKLAAYGVSVAEIINAIQREHLELAGGSLEYDETEISIRTLGEVEQIRKLSNIAVTYRNGKTIYLRDLAEVRVGIKERLYTSHLQGKEIIGINVIKQSGVNTIELTDRLKREIEKIQELLPKNVKIEIVKDASSPIRDSVNDVLFNLVLGSILATFIVLAFLRNLRSTVIIAISIPFSMIATVFIMQIMNFTLNTMTLLALSMAIGLLIDDAIVVTENIKRHLDMGKQPLDAARDATEEVGIAVLATTWVVIAVFFPIAMMTGIIGIFFKQFGFTMIFAILFSMLIALTLIPMLSSKHLKPSSQKSSKGVLGNWLDKIIKSYVNLLKIALKFRIAVLIGVFILFVGSLFVASNLDKGFISKADMGEFDIIARLDADLNLKGAEKKAKEIENLILSFPEVSKCYLTVNKGEIRGFVRLVDKDERERSLDEIASFLRHEAKNITGTQLAVIPKRGFMQGEAIQMYIQGPDVEKLQEYTWEIKKIMEEIPGIVDISSSYKPGKPEISIDVDHKKAADLGISSTQVANTIKVLFDGVVVEQFDRGAKEIDIEIRLAEEDKASIDDLKGVYLLNSRGDLISLEQIADIKFETQTGEVTRYNRSKCVLVKANLEGISMGTFNDIFNKKLNERINFEKGYQLVASGDIEKMKETLTIMGMAMLTAVVFIFLVLAAQFESYFSPLAVMFVLPLAITGGILGLYVTGSELSLVSMIGMVLLLGLAAKNGVLLIEFILQARENDVPKDEAILTAAKLRFRPIIMTTIALIISMIPLALALGPGGEQRSPMAHAIIGGMVVSTFLTLFVVPVTYSLLDSVRNKAVLLFKGEKKVIAKN